MIVYYMTFLTMVVCCVPLGDRTKHLKNLHGVSTARLPPPPLPAAASTAASTSASVVMSDCGESAKGGMDAGDDSSAAGGKMPSPMLASESSANAALGRVGGAKAEPIETSPTPPPPPPPLFQSPAATDSSSPSSLISALLPVPGQPAATAEETVTIALDEVMQFAQPTVVTEYY